jgi:hypothetical protein
MIHLLINFRANTVPTPIQQRSYQQVQVQPGFQPPPVSQQVQIQPAVITQPVYQMPPAPQQVIQPVVQLYPQPVYNANPYMPMRPMMPPFGGPTFKFGYNSPFGFNSYHHHHHHRGW